MNAKFTLLLLVAFCYSTLDVNGQGQDCVPRMVENLKIHADATLNWELSEEEFCEVHEFEVDIRGDRGPEDEYHLTVETPFADVSFLEICEEWEFTVTPIANGVPGVERRLTDHIPLPPSADLSLSHFSVSPAEDPRDVLLEWDLQDHTHGDCTLRYRITIEDEQDTHDLYVTGNSVVIHNLSPCVEYDFGIRAINRAHPTIEGPMRSQPHAMEPQPETAPILRGVDIGATHVTTTWRLENPGMNRCPILNLHVDGGDHFNIVIPIEDDPERPMVDVPLMSLEPDRMYFLKVSVENTGGMSLPGQVAVHTLEEEPGPDPGPGPGPDPDPEPTV